MQIDGSYKLKPLPVHLFVAFKASKRLDRAQSALFYTNAALIEIVPNYVS